MGIKGREPEGLRGNVLTGIVHHKDQQGEKYTPATTWRNPRAGSQHSPASLRPQGLHQTRPFLQQRAVTCVQCFCTGKPTTASVQGFY